MITFLIYKTKLIVKKNPSNFIFQDRAFGGKASDSLLGHTLVLLQYDWPNHATLFSQIIKKIQKQGNFSFNLFFNYIISILCVEVTC